MDCLVADEYMSYLPKFKYDAWFMDLYGRLYLNSTVLTAIGNSVFFYKFRCRIGNMPYVDSVTCGSVSMSWKVCLTELVNWCRVSIARRWLIGAAWAPQYFCAACQLAIYKLNPFMVGDWPWINLYLYPLKSHSDRSLFILYWRVLTNLWVWMHVNASIMTKARGLGFYRIYLVRWRRNMRKKHTHTYTPNVASSRFSALPFGVAKNILTPPIEDQTLLMIPLRSQERRFWHTMTFQRFLGCYSLLLTTNSNFFEQNCPFQARQRSTSRNL